VKTDPVTFVDRRVGAAKPLRAALDYIFPDHWSFLLGEIALYAFVTLVGTGVFLAFFFEPGDAYPSAINLSFGVPGGLLLRQTHHWAADVFVVAIVLHLLRVFFTGAFRRPRELTYTSGVLLLALAIFEGFLGYSLLDDLLSGMGLAIAYGVAMSIPFLGGDLAHLIWAGEFPGGTEFPQRLFVAHVFLLPALIAGLLGAHLATIVRTHHSQFRGPLRAEDNVVGTRMWPGYALRSLALLAATAAVLVALGGLIQVNPIWQWGPYEPYYATNGAQPDWYLGWLIGALRLMPPLEIVIGDRTVFPNPFFGGILFPSAIFGFLLAWPWWEQRRGSVPHHLLDRPRDNPHRTGVGAAVFTFVAVVFLAGSADRLFLSSGIGYETQVWLFRIAAVVLPGVAYALTRRACRELRDRV